MTQDASPFGAARQAATADTFVELVGTLVDDFDVIDLFTVLTSRCVELLDAAAAGILLVDSDGHLRVMGASTDTIALLELFQVQNAEGPCLDCIRTGAPVVETDLRRTTTWPSFAAESLRAGFPSVCALPLRLKDVVLGCLNLFMSAPVALAPSDVRLAQALADVSSIALVQDRAVRDAAVRETQLQHALDSRIVIEQAKGMIAEASDVSMDEAFQRLRTYARAHSRGLTDLASAVVAGHVGIRNFADANPPPR